MTFDKAVLTVLILLLAIPVSGQIIVLDRTDSPDQIIPGQIDQWIIEAEKGDWTLMREFAEAYLYPHECKKLKYGHRCRAMAARPEAGKKILLQIIDTQVDPGEPSREDPDYANKVARKKISLGFKKILPRNA